MRSWESIGERCGRQRRGLTAAARRSARAAVRRGTVSAAEPFARGIWGAIVLAMAVGGVVASAPQRSAGQSKKPAGDGGTPLTGAVVDPAADRHERRLFVPLSDLEAILRRQPRGVLLDRAEVERLQRLAREATGDTPEIPGPSVQVVAAQYALRFDEDAAALRATFTLHCQGNGWHFVDLPFRGPSFERVTLDEQPAAVSVTSGQRPAWRVFVRGAGVRTLTFSGRLAVGRSGADSVVAFEFPPVPAADLQVTVPAGRFLTVDGLAVRRPEPLDRPAELAIAVGGSRSIQLRLTDRPASRVADGLVFATTAYGVYVAPGAATWRALVSLQVFGTRLDRFTFRVPEGLEITDVESTGLEAWELADAEGGFTSVTLDYRQPLEGARTVRLEGVVPNDLGKPFAIPGLRIEGVQSHVGRLLIRYDPQTRVRQVQVEGVRPARQVPAATTDLLPGPRDALEFAFEAWREDFVLRLVIEPKQREVHAAVSTLLDVEDHGITLETVASIETFFEPLFHVHFRLPAEWQVAGVTVDGKPADWALLPKAAGVHVVAVEFAEPLPVGGERRVTLTADRRPDPWPVEKQAARVPLPEVELLEASVVEGTYMVRGDDRLELVVQSVSGLDPVKLGLPGERLGFRYQDTHFRGDLVVRRRPTVLASEVTTFTAVEPTRVVTHAEIVVDITGGGAVLGAVDPQSPSGGTRTLRIAVPEQVDPAMQFQLVAGEGRIVEQLAGEPADGHRVWTLRFDRWVRGRVELTTLLQVPRAEDQNQFTVPAVRVLGSDWSTGYVVLEARPEQRLQVAARDAAGHPLATVDALDIPMRRYVPRHRIVAAFRFNADGYEVRVTETTFERLPVPTAIAHRLSIRSVLSPAGRWEHHAELRFAAAGVQSVSVELPQGARLWSAAVDGRPQAIRKASEQYLITVPAAADPGAVRVLTLVYAEDGTPLNVIGRLAVRPPVFGVLDGEGNRQPLDTLQAEWSVHHGADVLLAGVEPPFVPARPLAGETLLGRLRELFRLPSSGEWAERVIAVAAAVLVLALAVSLYRRLRAAGGGWLGCLGRSAMGVVAVGLLVALLLFALLLGTTTQRARMASRVAAQRAVGFAAPSATAEVAVNEWDAQMASGAEEDAAEAPQPEAPRAQPPTDAAPQRDSAEMADLAAPPEDKPAQRPAAKKPARPRAGQNAPFPQSEAGEALAERRSRSGGEKAKRESGATAVSQPTASNRGAGTGMAPGLGEAPGRGEPTSGIPAADGKADERRTRAGSGLLSLQLTFEPPPGMVAEVFRYIGIRHGPDAPPLIVTYENRPVARAARWLLLTLMAFLLWWIREAALRLRMVLCVCGLCVPIAVSPLQYSAVQIAADGVFFGAVAGSALWGVRWAIGAVLRGADWLRGALRSVAHWRGRTGSGAGKAGAVSSVLLLAAVVTAAAATARAADSAGSGETRSASKPQSLVIPVTGELDPKNLPSGRVFLPWDAFERLWRRAHPERIAARPPVTGLISQAEYVIEASGGPAEGGPAESKGESGEDGSAVVVGAARVRGRIVAHNLGASDVWLRLPLGNVAVDTIQLDGRPADVRSESGAEQPFLVRVPPGPVHVLDLTLRLAVERRGPAGRIAFPVAGTAASRIEFVVPLEDADVLLAGAVGPFQRVRDERRGLRVVFPLRSGSGVTIAWQPRQSRAALTDIVHCESLQSLFIEDRGLQLHTRHLIDVRRGSVTEFELRIPADGRLQAISGPLVSGWEIKAVGDARAVRVYLREPVTKRTWVGLQLFLGNLASAETRKLEIPQVVPQDVQRDVGWLAIHSANVYGVSVTPRGELEPIHPDQFQPPQELLVQTPLPRRFAYRFRSRNWSVAVTVRRQPARSVAWAYHAIRVEPRKVRYATYVDLRLEDAARTAASLRLPADFVVTELVGTGVVDWYVVEPSGNAGTPEGAERLRVLSVEFGRPMLGRIELAMVGFLSKAPEATALSLHVPVPRGTDSLVTEVAVWVDPAYTAVIAEPPPWKSVDPASLSQRVRKRLPQPVHFGLRANARDLPPIPLTLQRARPQFRADSLTSITLSDPVLAYSIHCRWEFTRRADTFWFELPDWLGERVHIRGPAIRETTAFPDPQRGRVRWRVRLQEPFRKEYVLEVRANRPPPRDRIRTPDVVFLQPADGAAPDEAAASASGTEAGPALEPIAAQGHYVLLINVSRNQVQSETPEAIEPVDSSPLVVDPQLIASAVVFGRIRSLRTLPSWSVQRLEEQHGPAAVVLLADLVTVIAADGTYRTEATYTVRNRRRQFLAVEIPPDTHLMAVRVGDRPSRAVAGRDEAGDRAAARRLRIPLPKTAEAARSFPVRIVIQGRLPQALPSAANPIRQELAIPAPRVVGQKEDDELGVPVSRTVWQVFFPEQYAVTPIDDPRRSNLTPGSQADVEALKLLSYLDEASELMNVLRQKASAKQRLYAWQNLKQLGVAVRSYETSRTSRSRYGKDAAAQFERFNALLEENAGLAQQAEAAQGTPDLGMPPGAFGQATGSLDERQQVALIEGNSMRLYALNADRVTKLQTATESLDQFRFDISARPAEQPAAEEHAEKKGAAPGKSAQTRAGKVGARQRQLEKSLEQLRMANERIQQQAKGQAGEAEQRESRDLGRQAGGVAQRPSGVPAFAQQSIAGAAVMTGGFGGGVNLPQVVGGEAGRASGALQAAQAAATAVEGGVSGWTAAGGLSLVFEIPRQGRKLTFTKIGGDPRLRVLVRSEDSVKTLFAFGWCALWLTLAVSLCVALTRAGVLALLVGRLPWLVAAVGLLLFWFVPALGLLGYGLFVLASVVIAFRRARGFAAGPAA